MMTKPPLVSARQSSQSLSMIFQRCSGIARRQSIWDGQEKELAYRVAQLFEPVQVMIETLSEVLYRETS
ncbi:MAG: hypothetical protein WC975_15930 [Phycisphaerae bacterium]